MRRLVRACTVAVCRPHATLTKETGRKTTPAMAAGVTDRVRTIEEMLGLMEPGVMVG